MNITAISGSGAADGTDQRWSVHIGHDHVGDQQMDLARMAADQIDRLFAARRFQHLVAAQLEGTGGEAPHRLFVFDDQYGFLPGDVAQRRSARDRRRSAIRP